ncbi:MAG: aldo/keto reductase [Ktedonobacteraceae bacterium]|nr:aldo/keto reductase [Ktedonobacteraceae bacterium]
MIKNNQRTLGASGLVVPAMGVGIASWGEKQLGYGRMYTRDDVTQAYRACLDAGLNFFDTAEMYGQGESERLLGECRRQDGRPILNATKFSTSSIVTPSFTRSSPRALLHALDGSLQRLGVDCIDLYQLHVPPAPHKLDAYMDVLAEAVRAGKVRAVGLCNFNATLLRQAHARLAQHGIPLASTMVGYNLLRRYPETNGVLDACRELNVALLAFAPLAEGVLSGKYRTGTPIPGAYRMLWMIEKLDLFGETRGSVSTVRRWFSKHRPAQREKLEPLFVVLEEIARAHEKTIAQVALNWLMSGDADIIPIPGAKNVRQANENAGTLDWRLTKEEYDRINQTEIATR